MILSNQDDGVSEKTHIKHYVEGRGFLPFYLSKFHSKLTQ